MAIIERICKQIAPETEIPKPAAKAAFLVKGWGKRRGESALLYTIPNHKIPSKPYVKGVTEAEFRAAYAELQRSGVFIRGWFDTNRPGCSKEGGCNFTTIGGVFELLGDAEYEGKGVYRRRA